MIPAAVLAILLAGGGGPPTTVPRSPGGNRDSSFAFRIEVAFQAGGWG